MPGSTTAMFSEFVRLISRQPPETFERGFVREVVVHEKPPRNKKVERVIEIGWAVIVAKSVLVYWLFGHYHVPVSPWWVIAPTLVFAALITAVYLLRD